MSPTCLSEPKYGSFPTSLAQYFIVADTWENRDTDGHLGQNELQKNGAGREQYNSKTRSHRADHKCRRHTKKRTEPLGE